MLSVLPYMEPSERLSDRASECDAQDITIATLA